MKNLIVTMSMLVLSSSVFARPTSANNCLDLNQTEFAICKSKLGLRTDTYNICKVGDDSLNRYSVIREFNSNESGAMRWTELLDYKGVLVKQDSLARFLQVYDPGEEENTGTIEINLITGSGETTSLPTYKRSYDRFDCELL